MSYSKFTNLELKQKFGIEPIYRPGLFTALPSCQASELLNMTLAQNIPFALAQGTEKARSEYIIAPVLVELRRQTQERISIFSGWDFNVDKKAGLSGFCDFLVSRSPFQFALEAPVVVAVEAKQQNFEKGLTQCTAEMVAARIYNERAGNDIGTVYGCVTTGDIWRFLALRGNYAEIESSSFDITQDLAQILGILRAMSCGDI